MNPIFKPCAAVVFAVGALAVYGTMAQPAANTPAKDTAPCAAAEYRDFDFWIGDWDVFDVSDPKTQVAKARVDRILGGCVLREDYQDTGGHKGQSFSIYDVSQKAWHQSWVTNRGQLLLLDGGLQSGNMVLRAVEHLGDGKEKHIRGTWTPVEGGVRETALTSTDGGKTWGSWFDLIFRPHTAGNSFSDDEKAVAALDDEYQAAVKNNDAETMDRILTDDFVLVTGSGKKYTKGDLIADARSGRAHYEHQEDSERTVRVWGDTAVVTAKLWEQGIRDGKRFDYIVWFSDTYVRTAAGWKYAFGQSSLPLSKTSP